jgi:hypothetical protein
MTDAFDDHLLYYGCSTVSLVLLCDVSFTISKSHSLGKVVRCSFLVTMREVISRRSCLGGNGWDGALWG